MKQAHITALVLAIYILLLLAAPYIPGGEYFALLAIILGITVLPYQVMRGAQRKYPRSPAVQWAIKEHPEWVDRNPPLRYFFKYIFINPSETVGGITPRYLWKRIPKEKREAFRKERQKQWIIFCITLFISLIVLWFLIDAGIFG